MKKIFGSIVLLFLMMGIARAQSEYQPYSYQFYQKFNADIYSTQTNEHSAIKPFFIDSLMQHRYDSLMNYGTNSNQHGWNFFSSHLIDVKTPKTTFYLDLLPDFGIG